MTLLWWYMLVVGSAGLLVLGGRNSSGLLVSQTDLVSWLENGTDPPLKERERPAEPPIVKVTHKLGHGGLENFICEAHSFYPKEINVTWRRDGKLWMQGTYQGGISPSSDGTYHTWLCIEINPTEKDLYRCHVGHGSLKAPLVLAYGEPVSVFVPNVGLIVGIALGVCVILLVPGIIICITYRHKEQLFMAKDADSRKDLLKCGKDLLNIPKHLFPDLDEKAASTPQMEQRT
ncbi:major histocompatibility complex class I-related gene protein-like isoform X1 [Hemicordylus capensis]|uniref:major histocompatibility complex class I-related gene protein-like isoform X1 n=1 Tax=Hemicordylus capensis TaxID=884348 RepID=UPI002302FA9D|nr:major histocompatibility complex class I-related gene protein-like isoform X1 [Hemicordylus capensis]